MMMRCLRRSFPLAAIVLASAAMAAPADTGHGGWGFDLTGMDRNVRPGDDFNRFANGAWDDRTTIPDDQVRIGQFANMAREANERTRLIVEAIPDVSATPVDQVGKVGQLYRSFVDDAGVEARGRGPLDSELARIDAAANRDDLAALMGQANASLGASLFDLDLSADQDGGKGYDVYLAQGGLRLARDYYVDPRFAGKLSAYRDYVAKLLDLSGWKDSRAAASQVVEFESKIAVASWSEEQTRDPITTRNPRTIATLERQAPGFPWQRFFDAAGLADLKGLNLSTPSSVQRLAKLYATVPLPVLKAWLSFRTADNASPYLSKAFVEARFELRHTTSGQAVALPRWQQGMEMLNTLMGSAVGELYVARYYPPETEVAMRQLAENVRAGLQREISNASWMSDSTRREALRKLATLEVQVGRPTNWIDYGSLEIRHDDLFGNVMRARAFDWHRRVAQRFGPWNKSDWRFWPQYPTAYNEDRQLIFTAAMLQPPFFDAKADPAVNYGAIGVVIGHELSHNFDDQGRHVDADGRLRDWWTSADARRFNEQARRLSAQFSLMEPVPGVHIKGDLTLGENIADLAGMSIALNAYHASLGGKAAPVVDNLTGDQRFFLSWAQSWRDKERPDKLRDQLASDKHSPPVARVNGPMRNLDAWYEAWGINQHDKLFLAPKDRVRLW